MPDISQDSETSRQSNRKRGQGRERARRRGHRRGERKTVAMPAYITREIPYYEFLGEEELVRLEDQADWLIQEVGLEFRDDPEALDIWRAAGADVKDTRVRLPRGMARDLCKTTPTKFTQHARNPYDDVEPAGHFLGSAHTMANYETAYYDAEMSNSDSFEQWQEDGSKDTERRAFERWN